MKWRMEIRNNKPHVIGYMPAVMGLKEMVSIEISKEDMNQMFNFTLGYKGVDMSEGNEFIVVDGKLVEMVA